MSRQGGELSRSIAPSQNGENEIEEEEPQWLSYDPDQEVLESDMSPVIVVDDVPNTIIQPLKFEEPDLEIVIGEQQQHQQYVFKCHSAVLASQSVYVDTMLSLPMPEQSTKRITFPDMDHATWIRLIHFLTPSGARTLQITDIPELLPFLDKYEFRQGLKICDDVVSTTTLKDLSRRLLLQQQQRYGQPPKQQSQDLYESQLFDDYVEALALSYTIDLMPQSKNVAIQLAETQLRQGFPDKMPRDEDDHHSYRRNYNRKINHATVMKLFALIRDETLNYIMTTIMGHTNCMSIEEMRRATNKTSFDCEYVRGEYDKCWCNSLYHQGAMLQCYKKFISLTDQKQYGWNAGYFLIQATDPLGSSWIISRIESDSYSLSTNQGLKDILYKWNNQATNSIFPPRGGWTNTAYTKTKNSKKMNGSTTSTIEVCYNIVHQID